MLEKEVESKLKKGVESMGGLCLKLSTPGFTGVPDRLVILPGGHIIFVELKRPGQKERPRQAYTQKKLRDLGCAVYSSIDSPEAVEALLCKIQGRWPL